MMRIYVACLASYNNGILHGRWIDATTDIEAMAKEIDSMLKDSPIANAEEWAIHDSEGLGDVSEHTSLEEIARRVEIAEAAARYDLPVPVLLEAMEDIDDEDAESFVLVHYRGRYEDLAEFAEELCNECYDLEQIPDFLRGHIDWDGVARDMVYGGDIREIRNGGCSYVFWNY